ncbi:MAG TPA: alpha-L-arabinofuranosidase C-terminal domain-containing protein [Sedimentisphaerales bacterium]|jgi:alpha-N-arabinofuranosidase|nr:alpha-L-arabinofuranosidase C-terminal domain-containing protein [Sedimentisphaerales bacterium]HNU27855.1 alpha-L-arabinofuranosidase C-terminal domain-containing protein [Sedimentisphaerales bacterium]
MVCKSVVSTIRVGLGVILVLAAAAAPAETVDLVVLDRPLHGGRISPMLYGGFIELLDDVVPGMWAEMLGNRDFEGVLPTANWAYHLGVLNLCDRDWDRNGTWDCSAEAPWSGERSAKLTAAKGRPGLLTQSGLAVTKGMTYLFSGYFRGGSARWEVSIRLKALLPDGQWMSLGSASLGPIGGEWAKTCATLACTGTTDRAVLDIEAAGEGNLWMDKLSLMPADNVDGWRRDVVEATKRLRPPVLRWGGSTIDPGAYKWKEQVGDRDRRPTFLTQPWGRRDPGDVGVEEFVRFCRAVGSEPLVCVSFADGPESAGELVEYCNGAADTRWGKTRVRNGHPEPYDVKYWQLGNEVGSNEVIGQIADFCQAIHKADPKATIFTSFPSAGLLDRVGDSISYLCPHYYTSDLAWVESDIRGLRNVIRGSRYRDTARLAVTEWNINAGNWGLGRGKLYTLDCALFEARFLNLLHRNSDVVTLACRSNLTNSFCGGTIQTNAAGLYKIPAYHVMKLFRDHTRPVPLTIGELPGWLSVTACASDDHKQITLFVVNTRTEPVEVQVDLCDFGEGMKILAGEVVGDTQDRRQIDVANGWDRPDRVKTMPLRFQGRTATAPALSVAAVDIQ